jgi:hypothetical protein
MAGCYYYREGRHISESGVSFLSQANADQPYTQNGQADRACGAGRSEMRNRSTPSCYLLFREFLR